MNKWQIICPLAAVALFVAIGIPRVVQRINMHRRDVVTQLSIGVAWDLEARTNSTLLVEMPPLLKQELTQFLTSPTAYRDTFLFGDEPPPLGDGTATHRVYLRNFDDQIIALRLRYDRKLEKFHVLGFWRPQTWPDY